LSSTEPTIGNIAVVESPLVTSEPLQAPPGDLDLPLHPHPIM
jgi:hypothetical protein